MDLPSKAPPAPTKGRGALTNDKSRFEARKLEPVDDGWEPQPGVAEFVTHVSPEPCRTIISHNDSPDVPFEQSINPYRGCEHGCVYCFARPTHAYLNLSPGLDFETRLFFKAHAAELLEKELSKPGYRIKPIALGTNTDPYQPIERRLKVTRSILEVLQRFHHPCTIVTKGTLIERDLDLLADLAAKRLVSVMLSVTTLDDELKRVMEPRAAAPQARLRMIELLASRGVPVGALMAPVIPAINDHEIEGVVQAVAARGARTAGFVMLRLPHELKSLFSEWLQAHFPLKAEHVLSLIRDMRGGKANDPRFGSRMRGEGEVAELIGQRFKLAVRRAGLDRNPRTELDLQAFRVPPAATPQLALF
ncbi:MAG TPA: PA0069 family radical SAM protein [Steroidobacteraceae bacterium]|nr:PA0069 family radical SAM protein [Steroidobacteraceae bacterium]